LKSFVLVNVQLDTEKHVMDEIRTIPEVIEIKRVFGPYDIVVKIEFDNIETARNIIVNRIKHIQAVRSVLVLHETDTDLRVVL
jgi:DNA-binding Lrp family transcriptional regulator